MLSRSLAWPVAAAALVIPCLQMVAAQPGTSSYLGIAITIHDEHYCLTAGGAGDDTLQLPLTVDVRNLSGGAILVPREAYTTKVTVSDRPLDQQNAKELVAVSDDIVLPALPRASEYTRLEAGMTHQFKSGTFVNVRRAPGTDGSKLGQGQYWLTVVFSPPTPEILGEKWAQLSAKGRVWTVPVRSSSVRFVVDASYAPINCDK